MASEMAADVPTSNEVDVGMLLSPKRGAILLAAQEAANELSRAKTLWPRPYVNAHEGFAVLLEEVDELKAHVWTNQKKRDLEAMRKEAVQVAAMALRFIVEVCDEGRGRE